MKLQLYFTFEINDCLKLMFIGVAIKIDLKLLKIILKIKMNLPKDKIDIF